MPAEQALEAETEGQGISIGKGRGKGKKKENVVAKGKKNMKVGRTHSAYVLIGRSKNPVADPTELRRRRIKDAAAYGRVVKMIIYPAKRRSCPTTADTESSEDNTEVVLAAADNEIGSGSPCAIEKIALSGGERAAVAFSNIVLYSLFCLYAINSMLFECNIRNG